VTRQRTPRAPPIVWAIVTSPTLTLPNSFSSSGPGTVVLNLLQQDLLQTLVFGGARNGGASGLFCHGSHAFPPSGRAFADRLPRPAAIPIWDTMTTLSRPVNDEDASAPPDQGRPRRLTPGELPRQGPPGRPERSRSTSRAGKEPGSPRFRRPGIPGRCGVHRFPGGSWAGVGGQRGSSHVNLLASLWRGASGPNSP